MSIATLRCPSVGTLLLDHPIACGLEGVRVVRFLGGSMLEPGVVSHSGGLQDNAILCLPKNVLVL